VHKNCSLDVVEEETQIRRNNSYLNLTLGVLCAYSTLSGDPYISGKIAGVLFFTSSRPKIPFKLLFPPFSLLIVKTLNFSKNT